MSRLPALATWLIERLVPVAERDEVVADLEAEFHYRRRTAGAFAGRVWLARQIAGSMPTLFGRTCWRGWTGFEPESSRWRPGGPMLETWMMDLRYSARRLTRRRTYALMAVLTLALGAGGTAAIFSIVRAVLIEPLPITDEKQIGVFWFDGSWTEEEFLLFRGRFPGFVRVAAYRPQDVTLETSGQPLRLIRGVAGSSELFDVLGAVALVGRTFAPGDDVVGGERTAVLSYGLWEELGSDRNIIGRQLPLGGTPHTVIGVMPRGFWYPSPETRVWMTTPLSPERRSGLYTLVGRTNGIAADQMSGSLEPLVRGLGQRFRYPPQWDKTQNAAITPVREHLLGDVQPSLIAALVAMALILVIACVNVAALMLGQLGGRSTELAVRTALGAGRQRLLQQIVMEALLLGAAAGIAGAGLASAVFTLLRRSLPLGELAARATLDWSILWIALGIALAASVVMAIIPAIAMWRADLRGQLATTRTGGVGERGGRLEGALVVGQIALAVLLAGGAGLLIKSVINLRAIHPGIEPRGVVVADATLPTQLSHPERRRAVSEALAVLQTLPGITAAASTQKLPLRGSGDNWGLRVEGKPELDGGTTAVRFVSHQYFRALSVPIREGRDFLPSDREGTERVVIINDALAAKYFPGESALNRLLRSGFGETTERIVGVVGNLAEAELTDSSVPARYMLHEQVPITSPGVSFVITAERPEQIASVVDGTRRLLQQQVRNLALQRVTTMASVFDLAVGAPQRVAALLSLLAGLALVLGAIGIYGVIAHFVSRRTRDYGICLALGLPPQRVMGQVVRRGVLLAVAGSVLGIVAVIVSAGRLSTLLYGVQPSDAGALLAVVMVLMLTATLASFIPAWRASRTDPASVLRQQ
jgi:putative ABC transport system permease protein